VELVSVYTFPEVDRYDYLWDLLQERTPEQSISHTEMPEWTDHMEFVDSKPYDYWCFIKVNVMKTDVILGCIYLTADREVGITIFKNCQNQGVASEALKLLMGIVPGPLYANINPNNQASIDFFEGKGFKHIQNTYKLEE
jgi:RimJ/RimL family protein N-acetyltransferase